MVFMSHTQPPSVWLAQRSAIVGKTRTIHWARAREMCDTVQYDSLTINVSLTKKHDTTDNCCYTPNNMANESRLIILCKNVRKLLYCAVIVLYSVLFIHTDSNTSIQNCESVIINIRPRIKAIRKWKKKMKWNGLSIRRTSHFEISFIQMIDKCWNRKKHTSPISNRNDLSHKLTTPNVSHCSCSKFLSLWMHLGQSFFCAFFQFIFFLFRFAAVEIYSDYTALVWVG